MKALSTRQMMIAEFLERTPREFVPLDKLVLLIEGDKSLTLSELENSEAFEEQQPAIVTGASAWRMTAEGRKSYNDRRSIKKAAEARASEGKEVT